MIKETPQTLLGQKTPRVVIYKSESHKLRQAFNVAEGKTILQGMPVAINEDGLIEPYTDSENQIYLGIADTDSITPAYGPQNGFPIEVTVMVEAFAVLNAVCSAAMKAGYAAPTADTLGHFVKYESSEDESKFINITPTEEADDIIQILVR